MINVRTKNDEATARLLKADSVERGHNSALVDHCDTLAASSSRVIGKIAKDLDGIDNPELRDRLGAMYLHAGNLRSLAHTLRGVLVSTAGRLHDE
jgi:Mg2+ and Co2+ transporter CorA